MPLILVCSAGAFCTTFWYGRLVGLPGDTVTARAALDCSLLLVTALCLDWRRRTRFLTAHHAESHAKVHSMGKGKVKVC
jgi:hypothetical protein